MKSTDGTSTRLAIGISLTAIVISLWQFSRPSVDEDAAAPVSKARSELTPEPVRSVSDVGRSVEGRPIRAIRLGSGEYVVLIMASIHGNESAGTALLERLSEHVVANPELLAGLTLVLLPCVNPDGVEAGTRFNAQGVDLNRNFPAGNRRNSRRFGLEALSEPEALAIYRTLHRWLPRQIVTLHEPLACVDYDGPAAALAEAMGACCPLPVKKLGGRPGSLGSYAGETLGIPIITFELPREARTQEPEELWKLYGPALIAAVQFRADKADERAE